MPNKLANVLTQIFVALLIVSYAFSDFLGFPTAIGLMFFSAFGISAVRLLLEKHPRERLYDPLEERKLPRIFRKYVQRETPEMERHGFALIGDYLIYPEPYALHSRAFLSHDGTCFGYLAEKSKVCFYGFLSVFEDGTYLETSPLELGRTLPAPDAPIRFATLPNAPVDTLAAFHRDEVARIEQLQETRVLEFSADQYAEVTEYGLRLSDWDLYQQGERWTPPKGRVAGKVDEWPEFPKAESREPELVGADAGL